MTNLAATIAKNPQLIKAEIQNLTQDIEVNLGSSILYAFSPVAKIELLNNGNYLITITDKNGTTTGEIPTFSDESIETIISKYFQEHPIVTNEIERHNQSNVAHQDIRNLINAAIARIPTKLSDLENDIFDEFNFIKNFKQMLVPYNSRFEFPNIPPEDKRDMIFWDRSTDDLYLFGLGGTLTYTSIGLANQDTIYGGSA